MRESFGSKARVALQDGGLALPLGVAAVVLARDVVVVGLQPRGLDHLLVAGCRLISVWAGG